VDEFSVSRRRAGDAIVVAPAGEIDLATVDVLWAEIEAASGETDALVLDLRGVTFIDSAGLRLVLQTSRGVERFSVVRGPREVQRVFDLVGLDDRLTILDEPPSDA
jgi:anti-sigma B factor antagonist